MTAAMVERVDPVAGRRSRSVRGERSRTRGPGSLRVIDGGVADQATVGSCRVARPIAPQVPAAVKAPVVTEVSGWRLTERGIAVILGLLAVLVVSGVLCVVATFLQVTS